MDNNHSVVEVELDLVEINEILDIRGYKPYDISKYSEYSIRIKPTHEDGISYDHYDVLYVDILRSGNIVCTSEIHNLCTDRKVCFINKMLFIYKNYIIISKLGYMNDWLAKLTLFIQSALYSNINHNEH